MDLETPESQEGTYNRFEKLYDYSTLQQAYKAMQACQKEINNIWNDPGIEPELKKQMIDDLYIYSKLNLPKLPTKISGSIS